MCGLNLFNLAPAVTDNVVITNVLGSALSLFLAFAAADSIAFLTTNALRRGV
ncbi:Uncharacterised protein [Chlamydia trachomatis]|nr:Uncharacterised protein [Chlamydia trachomatis]